MTNQKVLSKDEVMHLAQLAQLSLQEDEIEQYRHQLGQIIEHINKLQEIDTSDVPAMTHATDATNVMFEDGTPSTRTISSLEHMNIQKRNGKSYFVVKKIM